MYELNLTGPWNLSKIEDNAYICFVLAHQRYGISVPTLFREYLRRIEYCDTFNDLDGLILIHQELRK